MHNMTAQSTEATHDVHGRFVAVICLRLPHRPVSCIYCDSFMQDLWAGTHMQGSDDGEAPHKLRDEPVSHQISLLHLLQHLVSKRLTSTRLMSCPVNTFTTYRVPQHKQVSASCGAQHSSQSAILSTACNRAIEPSVAMTQTRPAAFCRPVMCTAN